MKYVRVCINLTIYVQIIFPLPPSFSLSLVIRLTTVVRGEAVMWSIEVTVSNPKPLAQLPLAVPSIDIQLKNLMQRVSYSWKCTQLNTKLYPSASRPV